MLDAGYINVCSYIDIVMDMDMDIDIDIHIDIDIDIDMARAWQRSTIIDLDV